MVCDEGWLLASDRLRVEAKAVRVRSSVEKIVVNSKVGIAYSFFGDDCASLVGDQLIANLPSFSPDNEDDFRQLELPRLSGRRRACGKSL